MYDPKCPRCGEMGDDSEPQCWACGANMIPAATMREAEEISPDDLQAASDILDRVTKHPVFSMLEGEHCPHYGFCGGKLLVHESTTDDNPVFVCDTVGHSFSKEDFK